MMPLNLWPNTAQGCSHQSMLDQSSAFDDIDHDISLTDCVICSVSQGWYWNGCDRIVTERSQYVHFNGEFSNVVHLECGVPQGSVLGPLLYILYTADLIWLGSPRRLQLCSKNASVDSRGIDSTVISRS